MKLYTAQDAARLIDNSEGKVVDPLTPDVCGHAQTHVGPANAPILDQPWRRQLTTMYRNRAQAEKDLRDLLNRHSVELEALPNGREVTFTETIAAARQVHIAAPGGAKYAHAGSTVTNTTRQQLFVKLVKTSRGELHLRTMYLKG
jgi:hypothetical protein